MVWDFIALYPSQSQAFQTFQTQDRQPFCGFKSMKEKPNEKIARFQFGFRTCNHRSISQFSGKLVPDTLKDLRLLSFSAADKKKTDGYWGSHQNDFKKKDGGGGEREMNMIVDWKPVHVFGHKFDMLVPWLLWTLQEDNLGLSLFCWGGVRVEGMRVTSTDFK